MIMQFYHHQIQSKNLASNYIHRIAFNRKPIELERKLPYPLGSTKNLKNKLISVQTRNMHRLK